MSVFLCRNFQPFQPQAVFQLPESLSSMHTGAWYVRNPAVQNSVGVGEGASHRLGALSTMRGRIFSIRTPTCASYLGYLPSLKIDIITSGSGNKRNYEWVGGLDRLQNTEHSYTRSILYNRLGMHILECPHWPVPMKLGERGIGKWLSIRTMRCNS